MITLFMLGCHSKQNPSEQQPTAEEQKKLEQDYQKAMEEQKKLDSSRLWQLHAYVPHEAQGSTPKKLQPQSNLFQRNHKPNHNTEEVHMKRITLIAVLGLAFLSTQAFAQFGFGIGLRPNSGCSRDSADPAIRAADSKSRAADSEGGAHLHHCASNAEHHCVRLQLGTPALNGTAAALPKVCTPWTNWNTVVAVNSYGNTPALLQAINSGINSVAGLEAVTLGQAPRYPLYGNLNVQSQQFVAAQGATSDLSIGIMQANLQTLGTMRTNSQQRAADIQKLESQTYSSDPSQQTYMSTIQRINSATLMQFTLSRMRTRLLEPGLAADLLIQKQQQDALTAAFEDARATNSSTTPRLHRC